MQPAEAILKLLQTPTKDKTGMEFQKYLLDLLGNLNQEIRQSIESGENNPDLVNGVGEALKIISNINSGFKATMDSYLKSVMEDNLINFGKLEKQVLIKLVKGDVNISEGGNSQYKFGNVNKVTINNIVNQAAEERLWVNDKEIEFVKKQINRIVNECAIKFTQAFYLSIGIVAFGFAIALGITIWELLKQHSPWWNVSVGLVILAIGAILYAFYLPNVKQKKGAYQYMVEEFDTNPDRNLDDIKEAIRKYRGVNRIL